MTFTSLIVVALLAVDEPPAAPTAPEPPLESPAEAPAPPAPEPPAPEPSPAAPADVAPQGAQTPTPRPLPSDDDRPLPGHRFTSTFAFGAGAFGMRGIPAYGAEGILAIGGMGQYLGWSLEGSYLGGRTENGLRLSRFMVGPSLDVRIGPVGIGVGFFHAAMSITRATRAPDLDFGLSGLNLRASYDLVASAHHALFVGTRLLWGKSAGGSSAVEVYGGGLFLGWRFRN